MTNTYTAAMSDPALPVGVMLPVAAATVPAVYKRPEFRMSLSSSWSEVVAPMKRTDDDTDACRFGCKLYARRWGSTTRYAVHHSLTYGHSHSPNAR